MVDAATNWDFMLEYAKIQQQEYYELLSEWTKYTKHEHKYLRQNIGFALFGPPSDTKEANTKLNHKYKSEDIIDQFCYVPKAEKSIDLIYDKVCEFGQECLTEFIYFGIIFNITLPTKNEFMEAFSSNKEKKEHTSKEHEMNFQQTPVFKIKRFVHSKNKELQSYEWYIDASARVYKSWKDYKNSNMLPKCTMVIPKHGFYEPNPEYKITEEYSTVWLEVLESPECSIASNVLHGIDITSNVVGAVGLGLSVASIFTPIAPVTVGAVVASGLSGAWTATRSIQNLVDRSSHEESINITNRTALCSWLTVTGSVFGLAATGGNFLLTKAIQNGRNISNFVKVAYNAVLVSNLGINGCGVTFRAYCMYKNYEEGQGINCVDVLSVGTHVLFFGNAVLNFKFAGDLISSTQGKILDDYRASLRSKRLRKSFNRVKRLATNNNTDKISENAEIIRYINKKVDLKLIPNTNSNLTPPKSSVMFEKGNLIINGIALLNPMKFVKILHALDRHFAESRFEWTEGKGGNHDMFYKLKSLLIHLLKDVFSKSEIMNSVPDITNFHRICQEMQFIQDATSIFPLIFQIALFLTQSVLGVGFIDKAINFVWYYVKESLIQASLSMSSFITDPKMQKKLNGIIITCFEHMDQVISELSPAFMDYITHA